MESSFGSFNAAHSSYPSQLSQEPSSSIFNVDNDNTTTSATAYLQPLLSLPPLPSESDPSNFFNFFVTPDFNPLPLLYQPPLPVDYYSTLPDDFFSKPLPDLHSLEQPRCQSRLLPVSSSSRTQKLKRPRLDLTLSENRHQTLDSIVQSFKSPPTPPIMPHSEIARRRRQKISEKTRCLQKLMPWDKKMDTGTMLQEAYKYIRFLQAQISILQSMPITSCFSSVAPPAGFDYAGLGKLNRQQLLQVLVNSPLVQTKLYSQGFCIISHEQLLLLNKANERKTGSTSTTFSLW